MADRNVPPIHSLILDMDGVLWRDKQPLGNLPDIFAQIDKLGWRVVLATNNSTASTKEYLQKITSLGVSLQPHQVVTSSLATAHYLNRKYPGGGQVYIIGETGLVQALEGRGYTHGEKDPLAVVVGLDRQLTYDKLCRATLLIRSGLPFIATNSDITFPTPQGLAPGAGAILSALETASDTKPHVVGKPAPELYQVALERMEAEVETTLVVGDRLETDIAGAQVLGCLTALVLSGATSMQEAKAWRPAPDWIADDLTSLLKNFRSH